jgi:hypothetical protein
MYQLHALAVRSHGRIDVSITGQLENTCMGAEVIDKYPNGHRVYVVDPGVPSACMAVTIRLVTSSSPNEMST